MRLVIYNDDDDVILQADSNGEGRYIVSARSIIARREDEAMEYQTDDGYHVAGLVMAYFGAEDSREYLRRRLNEHQAEVEVNR